jgi:DNA-binding MarR family transcriptional regulator
VDKRTDQVIVKRFTWEIAAISVHLEELRQFWAKALGISGPQWMIVMAVADLEQGEGVPVNVAAKMLHVDSSFVTTQSKMLEKKGLLRRKTSSEDARIVQMSLTDRAYKHLSNLDSRQQSLYEFIFENFDNEELTKLTEKLSALNQRLEKASLKLALEA